MTAIEITRFDLSELTEVAVVCKKCGAKRTYPLDGERFVIEPRCHNCKESFGKEDGVVLYHLQNLMKEARDRGINYRLEFELPGKR